MIISIHKSFSNCNIISFTWERWEIPKIPTFLAQGTLKKKQSLRIFLRFRFSHHLYHENYFFISMPIINNSISYYVNFLICQFSIMREVPASIQFKIIGSAFNQQFSMQDTSLYPEFLMILNIFQ